MAQSKVTRPFWSTLHSFGPEPFSSKEFIDRFEQLHPVEWASIVAKYGIGGKDSGNRFSSFKYVAQRLEIMARSGDVEMLKYRDSPPGFGSHIIPYWAKTATAVPNIDVSSQIDLRAPLRPTKEPVAAGVTRKLPPTGIWMFVCKRSRWDAEGWLRTGEHELLYMVSKHNRDEVQVGDLAVLRLDAQPKTRRRQGQPAGIYAIGEVVGTPRFVSEPDGRFLQTPTTA